MKEVQTHLLLPGVSCVKCVGTIEKALLAVPGVSQVAVNLGNKTADVVGDVAADQLVKAVKEAGYTATV